MRALITGVTGQDGAYLSNLLLQKGYDVFGTVRTGASDTSWRLERIGALPHVALMPMEMTESESVAAVIRKVRPNEIYNLAAQSFVGDSFEYPQYTMNVNGLGTVRVLEAARRYCPEARIYQASTSEMFGTKDEYALTEKDPFTANSPYAAAKLYAHEMCRIYREGYGMHISCGILFNHESVLRGHQFVTQKICKAAGGAVHLGAVHPRRDWGYAGDYVKAMWLMLQQDVPDDYVIGTGITTSVAEFVELVRDVSGQPLEVISDEAQNRPVEVPYLCADYHKAEMNLGWTPIVSLRELVYKMLENEL